jgi:hypothetical protein
VAEELEEERPVSGPAQLSPKSSGWFSGEVVMERTRSCWILDIGKCGIDKACG